MSRVVYNRFEIRNTDGSIAGVLDGEYEAVRSEGQQFGWYSLYKVQPDGSLSEHAEANFSILGGGS